MYTDVHFRDYDYFRKDCFVISQPLTCLQGWFLLCMHSIIAETLDKFARYKRRPLDIKDKEFHQKVSRAWKQEKALAFCTLWLPFFLHQNYFCEKEQRFSSSKKNVEKFGICNCI